MIDHTGLNVSDPTKSKRFYERALQSIGYSVLMEIPKEYTGGRMVCGFGAKRSSDSQEPIADLWVSEGKPNEPRVHIALRADNREQVDAFFAAALEAGGKDNGKPGLRPHYHQNYYAAFVHDPDGHNIEVVCHRP